MLPVPPMPPGPLERPPKRRLPWILLGVFLGIFLRIFPKPFIHALFRDSLICQLSNFGQGDEKQLSLITG